ncbi:MAG: hypothetical protein AAF078_01385 [Planctomycetota bacterium]
MIQRALASLVVATAFAAAAHAADESAAVERPAPAAPETRVYDISPMLGSVEPITEPRFLKSLDTDFAEPLFGYADKPQDVQRAERIEQLVWLIQDTVGVRSDWRDFGGTLSSIHELDGRLVVDTTPDHHAEIAQLVDTMLSGYDESFTLRAHMYEVPAKFASVLTRVPEQKIGSDDPWQTGVEALETLRANHAGTVVLPLDEGRISQALVESSAATGISIVTRVQRRQPHACSIILDAVVASGEGEPIVTRWTTSTTLPIGGAVWLVNGGGDVDTEADEPIRVLLIGLSQ